jgi:dipeptidyl-peptidase-4
VKQAEFLEEYAATHHFSLGRPTSPKISPSGDAVFFLRSGPKSLVRDLYQFDVTTGAERVLITADQLLRGADEQLTAEEKARRERMRLTARGIAGYELSKDGQRILIPLSGRLFVYDRKSGQSKELPSKGPAAVDPRFSPDGKSIACIRDGDLYVIDVETGAERRLTEDATETLTRGLAEFVAQEEMNRMQGYWWSPDSKSIAYEESDTSEVETLYIADPAHPERAAQAWRYPRPGKKNAKTRLGILPATGGETVWVEWDREAYPYLAKVVWDEKAPPVLLVQNREQNLELLLAADPQSGATRELLREEDAAWLNIDDSVPKWLDSGEAFLWSSERDGQWQLELRGADGKLLGPLTTKELNYRRLIGVDETLKVAYVMGGADPTQTQIFRVPLAPGNRKFEQLTRDPGVHGVTLSKESGVYVLSASTLSGQQRQTVHRRDDARAGQLQSVAAQPSLVPNVELTTIGDDPRMNAAIIRPKTFQAGRIYPVIVSVYGGPHSQMVIASRQKYLLDAWLAEQGFIVVSLDGRGTPSRGREWERAIRGNLIDVPLADQAYGLQALGAKYKELDLSRVGVFGWSFGGYFSAMAVHRRPDVFHAAVAGAPVTDWLDYDTHYTERYLGLPQENAAGYKASSVLTYAPQLKQPLLVVHGTADDNVYFLHSVRLADALFRAGREFDFLPLTGLTHMVPDPVVTRQLYTRIAEYFLDHVAEREAD